MKGQGVRRAIMGFLALLVFSCPRAVAAEPLKGDLLKSKETIHHWAAVMAGQVGQMQDAGKLEMLEGMADDWRRGVIKVAADLEKQKEGSAARFLRKLAQSTKEIRKTVDPTLREPLVKEKPVLRGKVNVTIRDYEEFARTSYALQQADGEFPLYLEQAPLLFFATGATIAVSDVVQVGDVLAAEGGGGVVVVDPSPINPLGEQKTLGVLVQFQNLGFGTLRASDIQAAVNGPVSDYFREQSFGKTWFNCTQAVGPFTLPMSPNLSKDSQDCPTSDTRDSNHNVIAKGIESLAIEAATPFVNLAGFTRVLIVFPQLPGCGGLLGIASGGSVEVQTPDGPYNHRYTVSLRNGSDDLQRIARNTRHEFGHNLGVGHSGGINCAGKVLPASLIDPSRLSGNTGFILFGNDFAAHGEYVDPFSRMGDGDQGHYTPEHKVAIGWIPPSDVMTLGVDASDYGKTFTTVIHPLERPGANLLKIQKQVQSPSGAPFYYTVDNRQAIGFDSEYGNSTTYPDAITGALIRLSSGDGASTTLLDMQPRNDIWDGGHSVYWNAARPMGQEFTDFSGIRIVPKRNIGEDLEVEVTLPAQTIPPQPEFVGLENGDAVYGTVNLRAQVFHPRDLIDRVGFYKDGQLLGEVTMADLMRGQPADYRPPVFWLNWDTQKEIAGTVHTVEVKAKDSAGKEGVASVAVAVDDSCRQTSFSRVHFNAPCENQVVRGTVHVEIEAGRDIFGNPVSTVILKVDNTRELARWTQPPYVFSWNTTDGTAPNGVHILTAIGQYFSIPGLSSTYSVPRSVFVDNSDNNNNNPLLPDTTPPMMPSQLRSDLRWENDSGIAITVNDTPIVDLTWQPAIDPLVLGEIRSGVKEYRVYRNGGSTPIGIVPEPGTTYTDSGLIPWRRYRYTVVAVDAAGKVSAASSPVLEWPVAAGNRDITPPGIPPGLRAAAQSSTQINLDWQPSTDPILRSQTSSGVMGYQLFRNGSVTPVATIEGLPEPPTTYSDTGLRPGTTYSYALRAVDWQNNLSPVSALVRAATFPDFSVTPVVPGDTDGDGVVTAKDVPTLLKGLAGIGSTRVPASTDPRFPAWDVNGDGQVNQEDATGPTGLMQRLLREVQ